MASNPCNLSFFLPSVARFVQPFSELVIGSLFVQTDQPIASESKINRPIHSVDENFFLPLSSIWDRSTVSYGKSDDWMFLS